MKPQRFKIGQEVTIRKPPKRILWNPSNTNGWDYCDLKFGKVYKVKGYHACDAGTDEWFISLVSCRYQYCETAFAPIVANAVLESELQSIEILEKIKP